FSKLEIDDFHRVLRFIGYRSMGLDKIEFSKDQLVAIIKEAKDFCIDLDFGVSDFLKDILTKVPLFVQDGLYIKWAHKSIQEYFAASFIFTDSKAKQGKILTTIARAKGNRYANTLDIYYSIDPVSFRRFVIYTFLQDHIAGLVKLRKIWPNIEPRVATLLLTSKHALVRTDSNGVFSLMREWAKKNDEVEDWGSKGPFHSKEKEYRSLKILSGYPSESAVLYLLGLKRVDFITWSESEGIFPQKSPESVTYLNALNLEPEKVYILSATKTDKYFKTLNINELVNSFNDSIFSVDELKAKALINVIAKEIEKEQSDDFLMGGLE
ncbi:MAG TPA: hypothetical protein VF598_14620, partial [Hymenobacter sp.]